MDIFAPGVSITSASNGSDTGSTVMSGTSMASPHVAGAVALYLQFNPGSPPAEVAAALNGYGSVDRVTNAGSGSPIRLLFSNPSVNAPGTLTAQNSVQCLDVYGGSGSSGAQVVQWACHGGANQRFNLVLASPGYFTIVAQHSGQCLDVSGASMDAGAPIAQWPCHGGDNQQFQVQDMGNGFRRLVAKHSGLCADVYGLTANMGANLVQWQCWGGPNQSFRLN